MKDFTKEELNMKTKGITFTSEWDDGSVVTTPVEIYNERTGLVVPEISNGRVPEGMVEREYITMPDGEEREVCPECHCCVLKTTMVSDETGKGLHEEIRCGGCEGDFDIEEEDI